MGVKKKHKDDIASLELIISCDDCEVINSLKSNIIDSSRYQNYIKFIKNLENV